MSGEPEPTADQQLISAGQAGRNGPTSIPHVITICAPGRRFCIPLFGIRPDALALRAGSRWHWAPAWTAVNRRNTSLDGIRGARAVAVIDPSAMPVVAVVP